MSVAEPFRWDDPTQKLMLTIISAFAEFEREMITARLSGGRRTKARSGGYAGGRPPLGYQVTHDHCLEIVETEAAAVRRIFELRNECPGASMSKIANLLNAEGYTTKRGSSFDAKAVWRVLQRQDLYRGCYRYNGIESHGRHPAIIESG